MIVDFILVVSDITVWRRITNDGRLKELSVVYPGSGETMVRCEKLLLSRADWLVIGKSHKLSEWWQEQVLPLLVPDGEVEIL